MEHTPNFLSLKNQNYFEAILENFHDGIYITDNEANTVYLNHSYELISGLLKTEMLGQNMKQLVSAGVISMSGTLSVLETGESITIEQSFRTGKRAIITSTPIFDDTSSQQHIMMVLTIVREITEIHSLRNELTRLSQQNREYLNQIEKLRNQLSGNVEFIAADAASQEVLSLAEKMALNDNPILISGEPGTGKEKLARFIHNHSLRSQFSFLRINFAVTANVTPAEYLFGYEDENSGYHCGILENIDGGTLYINEIEELPVSVRDKFLSLLRDKSCVMGDGVLRKLNIRFIIGSEYSYEELQHRQKIQTDILQEFSMFPFTLLPLRERKDDIIPLAQFFLARYNRQTKQQKYFDKECQLKLLAYTWPQNVYELHLTVERAAIMNNEDVLTPDSLIFTAADGELSHKHADSLIPDSVTSVDLKDEVAKFEAHYMEQVFEKFGNIRDSAKFLGMDSSTFVRKRQRYEKSGYMK